MTEVAIIGGTGLTSLKGLEITRREVISTPYGEPSAPFTFGDYHGHEVVFLPRHGLGHTIPPHRINYRANIWAMKHLQVKYVIAVASVGGVREDMAPGQIGFPDEIIDYTWGRGHTFFEDLTSPVVHIDFTRPYCDDLRHKLIRAADSADLNAVKDGTYGATQGPRLETSAEIQRIASDGCSVVGMTGMPEASLARELELCYATCAVVLNWAAGIGDSDHIDTDTFDQYIKMGMDKVRLLLQHVIPLL
jgi:5'-methylthioinosine phosphorylase